MGGHAGHEHDHGAMPSRRLAVALIVSLAILALEVAGGLASNSLALLSDAGHVLTDVFAIGLAWFASRQAERPPNVRQTYGFHRAGILAALANAATLIAISLFIAVEAVHRLFDPEPVATGVMLAVAVVGLVANLAVAWYLRPRGTTNLNLRAALAHVKADALGSAAVIVGALAIGLGGPLQIDPLLSVAIGVVIVLGGWSIARETLEILMESAPRGVDVGQVVADLHAIPGVVAVHDVHVWSLAPQMPALSAHVRIDGAAHADGNRVLGDIQRHLAERFGIEHNTIQIECDAAAAPCPPDSADVGCAPRTAAPSRGTRLAK
jgi:cobalt-zinc-cadmium efflux system protein